LASGGADGDLCIWDVGNPLQPSLYPAMKSGAGGAAFQLPQPQRLVWPLALPLRLSATRGLLAAALHAAG
jgi:hypothetical protein